MPEDSTFDPIPSDITELLGFFDECLRDVRFPDVDRESLGALAEDVRARASDLQQLEAQVRAARETLEEARSTLRRAAHRGLGYATVYADGDRVLSERIAGLSLGARSSDSKAVTRQRPRRGRKAKDAEGARETSAAKAKPTAELPFANGKDAASGAA